MMKEKGEKGWEEQWTKESMENNKTK